MNPGYLDWELQESLTPWHLGSGSSGNNGNSLDVHPTGIMYNTVKDNGEVQDT